MSDIACTIGIDLGGQSIKGGLVDRDGRLRARHRHAVDASSDVDEITDGILECLAQLRSEGQSLGLSVAATGIVMPGYLDETRQRILLAANLPGLSGTDFPERVRRRCEGPVWFDVDGNAASMAEYRFGAGRGAKRLLVVVIGTGIGGSVILDGELLRIRNHMSGSLGHVIINAEGPACGCGARGCVETYASGRAIARRAEAAATRDPASVLGRLRAERGSLGGAEVAEAMASGDETAGEIVWTAGWWLGAGVASWSAIYAPDRVVVGGGIARLGEPLIEAIRTGFKEVGQPTFTKQVTLCLGELGADAGAIGAGVLAGIEHERGRI